MPCHFSPLSEGLVSFPPSCSWRGTSRCVYAHAQAYFPQVCLRDPTMSLHHKANGLEMLTKIFICKDVHCHYLHILNNTKKKLRTLWYIFKMKHCNSSEILRPFNGMGKFSGYDVCFYFICVHLYVYMCVFFSNFLHWTLAFNTCNHKRWICVCEHARMYVCVYTYIHICSPFVYISPHSKQKIWEIQ